jgi:hypothetical protein
MLASTSSRALGSPRRSSQLIHIRAGIDDEQVGARARVAGADVGGSTSTSLHPTRKRAGLRR